MSLSELKAKKVVNVCDGKCIGKVMDIEFNPETGVVEALVVPGEFDFVALLRGEKRGLIIPWCQICCLGDDIILVQVKDDLPI
ncbi:MAG: YlmC/YmxH family sporulation protein [Firmicutes bacterium]|nr:YlmC/YmxH family sporulation protein [Bacillota bacterium]